MRLASLASLLLVLAASPAFGAKVLRTKTGAAAHWDAAVVRVALDPKRPSAHLEAASADEALAGALATWNAIPEMRIRFVRADAGGPSDVAVRFCKGTWTHKAGLLGHTEFEAELETGIVTAAVVEVNECDYRYVGPSEVEEGAFDLQAVITHELGHALGLGHSEDPKAVMFTSTGSVRQRRPATDDRMGLSEIYGIPFGGMPSGKARKNEPDGEALAAVSRDGLKPPPTKAPPPDKAPPKPRASTKLPEGTVSVMRLDGDGNLLLVTAEPVLLPAIVTADESDAAPLRRARKLHKPRRDRRSQ